ncbi:MAG TPA: hypothetical protein ACHBX0_02375 [Arsenophonus sp.]
MPLRIEHEGNTIANYLTRIIYTEYNPFDPESAILIDFVLNPTEVKTIETPIYGSKPVGTEYGYVALYADEGPQELDYSLPEGAYCTVKTVLKNNVGDTVIVIINLRGQKSFEFNDILRVYSMNSRACSNSADAPPTNLILSYHPEDNTHLDLKKGFSGIIPLQSKDTHYYKDIDRNILVRVTINSDTTTNSPLWDRNKLYMKGDKVS